MVQLKLKDFRAAYQQVREPITEAEVKALSFPNDYERQSQADKAAAHISKASEHREMWRGACYSEQDMKTKDPMAAKLHGDLRKHHEAIVGIHTDLAARHAAKAKTAPKESAPK